MDVITMDGLLQTRAIRKDSNNNSVLQVEFDDMAAVLCV